MPRRARWSRSSPASDHLCCTRSRGSWVRHPRGSRAADGRSGPLSSSLFVVAGDQVVEQPHAIAGGAAWRSRAVLVGPGHAGDVEVRPDGALLHETLQELGGGDAAGIAAAADVL